MSPGLIGRFLTTGQQGNPRIDILTILSLPIHEHGISAFIYQSSFSSYRSCTCHVRFIPRTSFGRGEVANVKGIVLNFKFYLFIAGTQESNGLLCINLVYPATLL